MAKKLDRRVVRTRRQLSQALLTLVLSKDYDSITIQDITETADLNRATFYLHYGTKEELLVAALEARFDALVEQIDQVWQASMDLSDDTDFRLVFEHVAEHAPLYKVLIGNRGRAYVINRIIKYIAQTNTRTCEELLADVSQLPIPIDIISHHIAGSLYAQISWWIENDMPHSAETMAHITHTLCFGGVAHLMGDLGVTS